MEERGRIPIDTGFFVRISADGRALHAQGFSDTEALQKVGRWISQESPFHKHYADVRQWIALKEEQLKKESERAQNSLAKKTLDFQIDRCLKSLRKITVRPIQEDRFRESLHRAHGIPDDQD